MPVQQDSSTSSTRSGGAWLSTLAAPLSFYEGKEPQMKKEDEIKFDHNGDGIDRRGFLKCMAWAGTGTLCVMKGGVLNSYSLSAFSKLDPAAAMGELSFVQIS